MPALHVNDDNFTEDILQSQKPVLVDFWAPWCGPCRMMGPVVDELADDMGEEAVVAKINVDEAAATAASYGVSSIPAFAIIRNGVVVKQLNGVLPKEALREALTS